MALVAGVEYTFIITATNAAGSQVIGTAKATPFTRPGVPGVGTVTLTDKTAVITLVQAAANGSQITQYNYSTTGTAGPWMIATGTNTVSVTLPGSGTYKINLQAQNSAGTGLPGTNIYTAILPYRKDTIATITKAYSITVDTNNSNPTTILYVGLSGGSTGMGIRKIITNGTNTGTVSSVGTTIISSVVSLAINPSTKQIYDAGNFSGGVLLSPPVSGMADQVSNFYPYRSTKGTSDFLYGIAISKNSDFMYMVSYYTGADTTIRGVQKATFTGTSLTYVNDSFISLSNSYRWIAADKSNNDILYVNDVPGQSSQGAMKKINYSNNNEVTDVTYTGGGTVSGSAIAVDSTGNVYYVHTDLSIIYKITPTGERSQITYSTTGTFNNIQGIAIDNNDLLYVVEHATGKIWVITII